jgi:hypothetical protein
MNTATPPLFHRSGGGLEHRTRRCHRSLLGSAELEKRSGDSLTFGGCRAP